jgi:hypothetical protein
MSPQKYTVPYLPFRTTKTPGRKIIFMYFQGLNIVHHFLCVFAQLLRFLWGLSAFGAKIVAKTHVRTYLLFLTTKTPGR